MKKFICVVVILAALGGYGYWSWQRPVPALRPSHLNGSQTVAAPASTLAWPASQAAIALAGTDVFQVNGTQTPVPTASTAKVITSLMVLKQKPLSLNQQGPVITLTADDAARYAAYVARDGSVVPVQAGEQITEYQMLQAILLPSANNMADSLAIWAYGSLDAYAKAANAYLLSVGLKDTVVGSDASGLSPDTKSTAGDMVKLGLLAMRNPVLAQIVAQPTATGIPLTTSIKNVNFLLGTDGIIGIKTGNSDEAGGAFLTASKFKVGGQDKTVVAAVIGAPNLVAAMGQSRSLIQSAQKNFTTVSVIKKGVALGQYKQPWGGNISAIAASNLSAFAWNGSTVKSSIRLDATASDPQAGQVVGQLKSSGKTISVILKDSPAKPSFWWRLLHPLN